MTAADYRADRAARARGFLVTGEYGAEDIDAMYAAYLATVERWTVRATVSPIAVPAVYAAETLGAEDRRAGIHRLPHTVAVEAADAAGHSRKTTHPATYGQCPIIDDNAAHILRAYMHTRYPYTDAAGCTAAYRAPECTEPHPANHPRPFPDPTL